ncbi:MAG: ATP-binding protein [Candidatus Poribacteria bacterium]|nr:ATP-binding protein [Candidatus Poribacteria bacterium]
MPTLHFKVDAELLRELGERLVGKPHIALAELIKNSYDADATEVTIKFLPNDDLIEIYDKGHGMTYEEFQNFWMRIGTTHKMEKKISRNFGRTMSGSKGVGRLAVQFLANKLIIKTVPEDGGGEWLKAKINWEKAIELKEFLTEVEVKCNPKPSGSPFEKGTSIILKGLKHVWNSDAIRNLASEIWWLQPPFGSTASSLENPKDRFKIRFQSSRHDFEKEFVTQMNAIKSIWIARLVGKCRDGEVVLALEFPDGEKIIHNYNIMDFDHNNGKFNKTVNLNTCRFEIRIYNLRGKQKFGIKVADARNYFEKHGGIHVYDGGFRLPYYGMPESDWLRLEIDHSHRKNVSKLLPEDIPQVPRALHNLPTLGRVLGIVNVNTSDEPNLKNMITRDRLTKTIAYDDLVTTVRYAIDWYANEVTKKKNEEKKRETSTESTSKKFERVEEVLEYYEPEIPKEVYKEIYKEVHEATTKVKDDQEFVLGQMGMLAPLATAGISALSYQHELQKQFAFIENTINKIKAIKTTDSALQTNLNSLSKDLAVWLKRAKSTNLLFDYVADADNILMRDKRLRAKTVIEEIIHQTSFLARDTKIIYNQLDELLYLPKGSFAEWGAIFQNVFINAFTAMLDSSMRLLHISSRSHNKTEEILIQDTGYGINIKNAEKLFEPFERESKISPERKALGYGGTGLGLTIVRLVADNIGCRVRFVKPEKGFRTAFSIQWREDK